MSVWFEPWAEELTLPPGEGFKLVAAAPQPGQLEIDHGDSLVIVYGWPGSTIAVYLGDTLIRDFDIPFPDIPPNMTMKAFIHLMFGGSGSGE